MFGICPNVTDDEDVGFAVLAQAVPAGPRFCRMFGAGAGSSRRRLGRSQPVDPIQDGPEQMTRHRDLRHLEHHVPRRPHHLGHHAAGCARTGGPVREAVVAQARRVMTVEGGADQNKRPGRVARAW